MKTVDHLNIFIPAYNEEESLLSVVESTITALEGENISFSILIGDDGSTDNTALIAKNLSQKNSKVSYFSQERNCNLGPSFRRALSIFETGFFSWIPSDGEIDPKLLCELYRKRGEETVVYSSPVGSFRARGFVRTFLSFLYQLIFKITFRSRVTYFNGPSLYPLKKLKTLSLVSEGFAINAEMILRMRDLNVDYKRVCYALRPRVGGKAKALCFSNFKMILTSYIRLYKSIKVGNF